MGHSGGGAIGRRPIRRLAKQTLANLPLTVEAYQTWVAKNQPPSTGFSLERLSEALPTWVVDAEQARQQHRSPEPEHVLLIGYLSWWLEYASALAALLAGLGHRVGLAYLPYRNWRDRLDAWELRRQSAYLQQALAPLSTLVQLHDLTQVGGHDLPPTLEESIRQLSHSDVQYTLQKETLVLEGPTPDSELLALRTERNRAGAAALLRLIAECGYQAVVVPNGSILEFGAVLRAAQHAGVRVSSYEFGEQRQRVWIAQDIEVMLQDTGALWEAAARIELTERQSLDLEALLDARRGGRAWSNFERRWQAEERTGSDQTRARLGLTDQLPVVLLCTNVVGDSLALNRQLFTDGMADWLQATARYFANTQRAQLVVRVHPGELIGAGLPSVKIMQQALPDLPEHVNVVPPDSSINTYDLIEQADLGLVYTTTVGLEMAMAGIPVVVAGRTHYARKGFTHDPVSVEQYFAALDQLLAADSVDRLSGEQVDLARRYAYRFFFDYPFRFPWHLVGFWDDLELRPHAEVFKPENLNLYRHALSALLGTPIDWTERLQLEPASGS